MTKPGYKTVAAANRKRVWSDESRKKIADAKRKWHAERGHKQKGENAQEAASRRQEKASRQKRLIEECGGHWVLIEKRPPGYYWVYVVMHPVYGTRWVRRSHLVVTDILTGSRIPKGYVVHHRNKNREDDTPVIWKF